MPVAAALIWKWLLNSQYGLVNQVLAFLGITPIIWLTDVHHILFCVMLVGIWLGVAYDLIIIIAGIKGIPQMYYEAAEIDGASSAYQFFFITLPLVTPSLFFIVITQMINSFKVFDSASVILGVDPPLSLWNAGSTIVMLMKTFLVLNVLYYAQDGLTQKEICGKTFQSKQTVSLIIKSLHEEGYLTLMEKTGDKRNKTVKLTASGRAYAERPVRHITWAEDTAMSRLSVEEQEQLIALSRRFTLNLAELVNGSEEES